MLVNGDTVIEVYKRRLNHFIFIVKLYDKGFNSLINCNMFIVPIG